MGYIRYNTNPISNLVGDCVVRAISILTDETWDDVYWGIAIQGFLIKDMPSSNSVWSEYLTRKGFRREVIPNTCPACYSVREFCEEHPYGKYLLATGSHVIAVVDGNYYDTWDSGDEIPIYYWERR